MESLALSQPTRSSAAMLACPWCEGPVDVRSPHVVVAGSAIRVYCSDGCLTASASGVDVVGQPTAVAPVAAPRGRLKWLIALPAVAAIVLAAYAAGGSPAEISTPPVKAEVIIPPPPALPAIPVEPAAGPPWPPSEEEWLADLAQDAWIHPLQGPTRRMPVHDSRVFGAERPGERPAECFSGHCGLDLGGEVWGEPVHAVHDGVVDRVVNDANNERGGIYVKISHRNGTVFSWYFHLAAVPRWAHEGAHVKAGDVIGLLGDTGVKRSGPHLHFQISVKPSAALPEQYIDPEPLLALWPLWVPEDQGKKLTIGEPPGVPRGAHRKRKKKKAPEEAPATSESHAAAVEEPASD